MGQPIVTHQLIAAKLFCSDVTMEVTTEAGQILGGYDDLTEYPVERMIRDVKVTQTYEAKNEIQRLVIARRCSGDSLLTAGCGLMTYPRTCD